MVDETPVYVMKGEYEYPGADGQIGRWSGTLMRLDTTHLPLFYQRMLFPTTQKLQQQWKPNFDLLPKRKQLPPPPSTRSSSSPRAATSPATGPKRTSCWQDTGNKIRP